MKDSTTILSEAPISQASGIRLAFVCSACPWWTNSWTKAREGPHGVLFCGNCGAPLRELPLEVLIETTREQNPDHFEGFLRSFSDNWGRAHAPQEDLERA